MVLIVAQTCGLERDLSARPGREMGLYFIGSNGVGMEIILSTLPSDIFVVTEFKVREVCFLTEQ